MSGLTAGYYNDGMAQATSKSALAGQILEPQPALDRIAGRLSIINSGLFAEIEMIEGVCNRAGLSHVPQAEGGEGSCRDRPVPNALNAIEEHLDALQTRLSAIRELRSRLEQLA